MHMTLLCFAQLLGGCSLALLSCWGDAPSLHSVAGGMLPCFTQLLGGCSLTSLSHWGTLLHFTQSLGGCSLTSLSCWGDAPSLHSVTLLSCFPFNGSIKLLQNLHSRGSMKQHFYVWEPHHGCLLKVKMAKGAINMHSRGSMSL